RLPGDAGGSLTSGASSMPHLDQHSALPPESIMGCDKTPHFGQEHYSVRSAKLADDASSLAQENI
ncbi:hypothetical protein KUCAC02_030444, partial [Chaenocephalus aceratus]